jgi:acyl-CoA reductase-like NAD-dependent aldehyde dehydrogenase
VSTGAAARLDVARTCKLYVGGAFPRSESGRTTAVAAADGRPLGNVSQASRKDLRDAVVAARAAAPGWAARTAYNRGQVLYRVAEVLQGRRDQLAAEVGAAEGLDAAAAAAEVDAAVDRWVWYAGWPDKLAQVLGSANSVQGPYLNVTTPEPVGVVGVLAPQRSSLLGLTSALAPALAAGCTAVVVASETRPIPAVTLAEVLHASDVPAGAVNVLTGRTGELAPVLASHGDVDALDLAGADPTSLADLEHAAAAHTTRVVARPPAGGGEEDWHEPPTTARLRRAVELKTVWHPAGT